jgi:hypothetical protein
VRSNMVKHGKTWSTCICQDPCNSWPVTHGYIECMLCCADVHAQPLQLPSLTMALPARGAARPFKGAQQAPVEHHQAGGAATP